MNRLKWLHEVAIPETEATLRHLQQEALTLLIRREVQLQADVTEAQPAIPGRDAIPSACALPPSDAIKTADTGTAEGEEQRTAGISPPDSRPRTPTAFDEHLAKHPWAHKVVKGLVDGQEGRVYATKTCSCHCGCRADYTPRGPRSRYCLGCASCPRLRAKPAQTKACACACGCKAVFQQGQYRAVNCEDCRRNPQCHSRRVKARTPPRATLTFPVARQVVPEPAPPVRRGPTVVSEGVEYETVWSGGEGLTSIGDGGSSLSGAK